MTGYPSLTAGSARSTGRNLPNRLDDLYKGNCPVIANSPSKRRHPPTPPTSSQSTSHSSPKLSQCPGTRHASSQPALNSLICAHIAMTKPLAPPAMTSPPKIRVHAALNPIQPAPATIFAQHSNDPDQRARNTQASRDRRVMRHCCCGPCMTYPCLTP
jgi:hypothetical protein